ncbi:NACHT domain-containing protein [Actinoallomurus vinaceus]|uniref:NACHT domain-containing protein n=2 Tax=Actinoallomurus vinaceus TaxID=1080074 RepID=A0ABP8UHT0_9ACTN
MTVMAGRGAARWREVVVVAGMAVLAGLVVVVTMVAVGLRGGDLSTAANVAQLMSVALAVPPLAVGLMVWWRPFSSRRSSEEQLQRAEAALRALVSEQWRDEIRIRGLDDMTPLVVRWRLTELDAAGDPRPLRVLLRHGRIRFTGRTDRMDRMARRFRRLARRRLVILGEPGMGKTTLAVLLLRELLKDPPSGEPVPVLLSMTGWDPRAEPVHRWLARRLDENYPALRAASFGRDAPRALVSKHRILPVLDGLDELPEHVQPRVLSALNAAATTEAVILTCRTAEYRHVVELSGGHMLAGGAVIEPRTVKAADAAAYIRNRLPPSRQADWAAVLSSLTGNPDGPLVRALSTPLALWLLRKVYIDTRRDPAPLRDRTRFPTADAVTEHLLDDLVDATLAANPPEHDPDDPNDYDHPFRPLRRWDPDDARRWLSFLAHHMSETGTRDLQWWRLHRAVHRRWGTLGGKVTVGLVVGLTVGLTGGVTIALTRALHGTFVDAMLFGVTGGLIGGLVGGLTAGLLLELRADPTTEPAYANLRPKGRVGTLLANLAFGLTVGLVVGVITALAFELIGGLVGGVLAGLAFGLAVGAAGGLTVGLSRWAATPVTDAQPQTPSVTLRRDLELVSVRSLAFGLMLGPAFGIAGAVAQGFTGLIAAVEAGISFGVAGGVVFVATFGFTGAGPVYLVAVSVLYVRRRVPRRLMRFLDDAHRLGLLREAGPAFQFRHAKLQDRLAQLYDAGPAGGDEGKGIAGRRY